MTSTHDEVSKQRSIYWRTPTVSGLVAFIMCCMGAAGGCIQVVPVKEAPKGSEISMSPVSIERTDGTLVVAENDVQHIAKVADVPIADVKQYALPPDDYSKQNMVDRLQQLDTDNEERILRVLADMDRYDRLPGAPKPDAGTDQSMRGYTKVFLTQAASRTAEGPLKAALMKSDSWDDLWTIRQLALRSKTAKDAARTWILSRIGPHEFVPSMNITVEAVSRGEPILVSEKAFMRLGDSASEMVLTRKSRDCNLEQTSCRFVYTGSVKTLPVQWEALFQSASDAGVPTKGSSRDLNLRMLVGGKETTFPLPVMFFKFTDQRSPDGARTEPDGGRGEDSLPPPPPPPPPAPPPPSTRSKK